MAPRGAAVHRRRRGGELGRLPLPHRRCGALRSVGRRGFRQPRPDQLACRRVHAGGGRPWARTPAKPCATSLPSAAPSSQRHNSPGVSAAPPVQPPRRQSWPPKPTNVSLCQRRRSLSTPTSGTPAPTHSGGPATRCSRDWRPGSPNEWDGSPQTARPPCRYPSTSAPPAIPGPTPSPMSTSPSTLHPRRPTCARSAPRQSKR